VPRRVGVGVVAGTGLAKVKLRVSGGWWLVERQATSKVISPCAGEKCSGLRQNNVGEAVSYNNKNN
jgi:hypothetical protein